MNNLVKDYYNYLPISERDKDWGLVVNGIGCAKVEPNVEYPVGSHPNVFHFTWEKGRRLNTYQLLYILDGVGEFESEMSESLTINAGSIVMLFPDVWHRYRPKRTRGWTEMWVGFEGTIADRWIEKGFFSRHTPITQSKSIGMFKGYFESMITEVKNGNTGYQQSISADLTKLLTKVYVDNKMVVSGGDYMNSIIKDARSIMLNNLLKKCDMQELANSLNVSYEHFRRSFKQATGHAPGQYFIQLKLNHAKELLCSSEASIKSISNKLDFESPYYFSKLFKKKNGVSPKKWRALQDT